MAQWTHPYKFRHCDFSELTLYVSGKRVTSEGLTLVMEHEKTSVMGYRTV